MWLRVPLPHFLIDGVTAKIARRFGGVGDLLEVGDPLLDLMVDLSGGALRDCPPVSVCRVVMRERGWLREIAPLGEFDLADTRGLAMLSSEPDTPHDTPTRDARTTVAAIVHHEDWGAWGAAI
jgi:hypothetical protein